MKHRMLVPLSCYAFASIAVAASPDTSSILSSLTSAHAIGEVAISPNGTRLIYGNVVFRHADQVDVMSRVVNWFDVNLRGNAP